MQLNTDFGLRAVVSSGLMDGGALAGDDGSDMVSGAAVVRFFAELPIK